jgi:hypothetical protein
MVLGHISKKSHGGSARSSMDGNITDEDETVVSSEQGNVLTHIISQLRPGAELSRVTLPTFILEPRSMLERITNFMAHPDTLLPLPTIDDPVQRFVAVTKFYLSGWHIKPAGVKKPLNPILGETFTGFGLPRWHTRLLHLRANITPPPQVLLLFPCPRTPHPHRRNVEASQQVPGEQRWQLYGGNRCNAFPEQKREIVCALPHWSIVNAYKC